MSRGRLEHLIRVCTVVVVAAGCADPLPPNAMAPDSAAIRALNVKRVAAATSDGRCTLPGGTCGVTFTATPANYYCATNCINGPAQTSLITVVFSKPIYQLIVIGSGGFFCSGDYGGVTVHNAHGDVVEQRGFTLTSQDDCGWDNVSCCLGDTLQFPGGITSREITPPQPWTGDVCYPPPSDTCNPGYVSIWYSYSFYEKRPPTVSDCLTGDELLDQQAMRDLLRTAWDSSHASDVPASRRETNGYLFEDSTGALNFSLYQYPTDTPCNSSLPALSNVPGIPLAPGHTHPFAPRDTLFPPLCGFTTPRVYDTVTYGGASDLDITAMGGDMLPFYILDKNNIYAYPAIGVTLVNAHSMVRTYPRVDPSTGCTRL